MNTYIYTYILSHQRNFYIRAHVHTCNHISMSLNKLGDSSNAGNVRTTGLTESKPVILEEVRLRY